MVATTPIDPSRQNGWLKLTLQEKLIQLKKWWRVANTLNKVTHYFKKWTTANALLKKRIIITKIWCFKQILLTIAVLKNYNTLKEQHCSESYCCKCICYTQRSTLRSETIFGNWKPFTNDEKCFLFHLKSSFRSQDI